MNTTIEHSPDTLREMIANGTMTHDLWKAQPRWIRERVRDTRKLLPQLIGYEGCRVEYTNEQGERVRRQIGISTGWRPVHLELYNARSSGGAPLSYAKDVVLIRRNFA